MSSSCHKIFWCSLSMLPEAALRVVRLSLGSSVSYRQTATTLFWASLSFPEYTSTDPCCCSFQSSYSSTDYGVCMRITSIIDFIWSLSLKWTAFNAHNVLLDLQQPTPWSSTSVLCHKASILYATHGNLLEYSEGAILVSNSKPPDNWCCFHIPLFKSSKVSVYTSHVTTAVCPHLTPTCLSQQTHTRTHVQTHKHMSALSPLANSLSFILVLWKFKNLLAHILII